MINKDLRPKLIVTIILLILILILLPKTNMAQDICRAPAQSNSNGGKSSHETFSLPQTVGPIQFYSNSNGPTSIQWVDLQGNWHDVENWKTESGGAIRWYVAPEHVNTGPYRFCDEIACTDSFYLRDIVELN